MGLGEACALASALAWAYGVILYQRLGADVPPVALNLVKNLLVLAMLVPALAVFGAFAEPQPGAGAIAISLASGALGIGLADTLYFRALNRVGAARLGILGNLYSPFVIVLSVVFLGERLGPLQLVGFALVSAGVLLVADRRTADGTGRALHRGLALGVLAIFLMAVSIVLVKPVLEREALLPIVALRLVGGVLAMLALAAALPGGARAALTRPPRALWGRLAWAAFIGQFLATLAWLAGYKFTTASVASILNESSSVFIVLLAWALLGEPLGPRRVAGVTCTLAGVACMLI